MSTKEKIIALVNAYFDGKEIRVDDLDRISTDWINSNNFWTYLEKISKDPKRYHVYIEL